MSKINLKNVVPRQLPEFIREDISYENFVAFLEAYYDFQHQQDDRSIEDVRDIDKSLDDFILNFKYEFNLNNFNYPGSEKLFLKHVRDLYSAKGSEASYNLLFRLLYNKPVRILYPGDFVLKPDDGIWVQELGLFMTVSSGNANDLVGKEAIINTSMAQIKVFVEKVSFLSGNTYQIFINKNYNGIISVGDVMTYEDFEGTILPTTSRLKIEQGGSGFKLGQLFDIDTGLNTGTKIKITRVDNFGKVLAAQIIQFGVGYDTEFLSDITNKINQTNDTSSSTATEVLADDFTQGFIDAGYINQVDYHGNSYVDGSYVGEVLTTFFSNSNVSGDATACVVRFYIGAVCKYPGYFETNAGFLDDAIYLQDDKYYQSYSYVVRIEEQLKGFKDIVKSYIHPSGTIMFSEYEINNELDLSLQATPSLA